MASAADITRAASLALPDASPATASDPGPGTSSTDVIAPDAAPPGTAGLPAPVLAVATLLLAALVLAAGAAAARRSRRGAAPRRRVPKTSEEGSA